MAFEAKDVWAYLQCSGDDITDSSLELLSEVKRLAGVIGGNSCALLVGKKVRHLVSKLGRYGVGAVYTHENVELPVYCPEVTTSLLVEAINKYAPFMVLFPGTHLGNDLACRVSLRVETRLFRNCVNFEILPGRVSVVRPIFHRHLYAAQACTGSPIVATLVPGTVSIEELDHAESPREVILEASNLPSDRPPEPLFVSGDPRTLDLNDADVIVAGGRGIGQAEGLDLLRELADELGGTLGVSRPLVDNKWAPFERQVGQTGTAVRPKLYLACGISGATQHLAGIRDAGTVVAINKDPAAPIFNVAALAAEGDLYQIVPELIRLIRQRKLQRSS
jgi:electron transfer flavoprotein alpha subunit